MACRALASVIGGVGVELRQFDDIILAEVVTLHVLSAVYAEYTIFTLLSLGLCRVDSDNTGW